MVVDLRVTGAESLRALARDLRGVEQRKEILMGLRKELRKPVPTVRKAIKATALARLPKAGGLNRWVAGTRVTASVRVSGGSTAGVTMKGGRNSSGSRSDIRALDGGQVRAPSWGRRGKAAWHVQAVPAGFFSDTVADHSQEWQKATLDAVEKVVSGLAR